MAFSYLAQYQQSTPDPALITLDMSVIVLGFSIISSLHFFFRYSRSMCVCEVLPASTIASSKSLHIWGGWDSLPTSIFIVWMSTIITPLTCGQLLCEFLCLISYLSAVFWGSIVGSCSLFVIKKLLPLTAYLVLLENLLPTCS